MLAPPPETPPRPWFKQNLPAFASASQSPPQHLARISQLLWRASQGFPQAIGRACRQNAPRNGPGFPPVLPKVIPQACPKDLVHFSLGR